MTNSEKVEKAKEYLKDICPICNDREGCLEVGCNCYIRQAYLDGLKRGREESEVFGATYFIQKNEILEIENEELKVQAEKMRCCGNCKHYDNKDHFCCLYGVAKLCDKWELAE